MVEDDFEKTFLAIMAGAEKELKEKGMAQAGLILMALARDEVNKVPLDEGTLSGSGSVFVGSKLIGTSAASADGGSPNPADSYSPNASANEIVGTVGFNTPYAARLHEHPEFKFQGDGRGAKYLESKLSQHRNLLMETLRDAVVDGMEGAAR
jgi:hypothetical protein